MFKRRNNGNKIKPSCQKANKTEVKTTRNLVSYKAVTTLSLTLSLLTSATSRIWQHSGVTLVCNALLWVLINET